MPSTSPVHTTRYTMPAEVVAASRQFCQIIESFRSVSPQDLLLQAQAALQVLVLLVERLPPVPKEEATRVDFDDLARYLERHQHAVKVDLPAFSQQMWRVLPSTDYEVPGHLFTLWGALKLVHTHVKQGWVAEAIHEWRSANEEYRDAIAVVLACRLADTSDALWRWQDHVPAVTWDELDEDEFVSEAIQHWQSFCGDVPENRAAYALFWHRIEQVMVRGDGVPLDELAVLELLWHIGMELGRSVEVLPLLLQVIDALQQRGVADKYERQQLERLQGFLLDIPVTPHVSPAAFPRPVWQHMKAPG